MLKMMGKKIFTVLRRNFFLSKSSWATGLIVILSAKRSRNTQIRGYICLPRRISWERDLMSHVTIVVFQHKNMKSAFLIYNHLPKTMLHQKLV